MADPRAEDGHVRIPNELFEALCRTTLPARHRRVFDAILRLTWGWQKDSDRISAGQLADLTSIDRSHVQKILHDLADWHLIMMIDHGPRRASEISIEKDFEKWSISNTSEARRRRSNLRRDTAPPSEAGHRPRVHTPSEAGGRRTLRRDTAAQLGRDTAHSKDKRHSSKTEPPRTEPESSESLRTETAAKRSTRHSSRAKRSPTDPPEALSPDELEKLHTWALDKEPWAEHRVEHYAEACLDWFRGSGRRKTNWLAVVRGWIRKERATHGDAWAERLAADDRERVRRAQMRDQIAAAKRARGIDPDMSPEELEEQARAATPMTDRSWIEVAGGES